MSTLSANFVSPRGTTGGSVGAPDAPGTAESEGGVISAARLNGLRAGVLGANDGIVSVAAIVVGVAGATSSASAVVTAAFAGLVAGALSMATGEYVSVSSQRDAERAGTADSEAELTNPWHAAFASLAAFVVGGIVPVLAVLVPWGVPVAATVFVAVALALVVTGLVSARIGNAPRGRAVVRNVVGGAIAMAVTFGIGSLVGAVV